MKDIKISNFMLCQLMPMLAHSCHEGAFLGLFHTNHSGTTGRGIRDGQQSYHSQKNVGLNKRFHMATQSVFNRPTVGMLWFAPLEKAVGCALALWYHS
jgi:hypothetical protein